MRESRLQFTDKERFDPVMGKAVQKAEKGSRLFAYKRGTLLLAVNPGLEALELKLDGAYDKVYIFGSAEAGETALTLGPQSFTVLEPCGA